MNNNEVFGSVELLENAGGAYVTDNQITDVLTCGGNDPAPRGQGNSASSMEGQCENF